MKTTEIVRLNEEIYKLKKKFRKLEKSNIFDNLRAIILLQDEIYWKKKRIKRNNDLSLSMWFRLKRAIRKFRGKM